MTTSYWIMGLVLVLVAREIHHFRYVRRTRRFIHLAEYLTHEIASPLFANRIGAATLLKRIEQEPGKEKDIVILNNILTGIELLDETIASFRIMTGRLLGTDTKPKRPAREMADLGTALSNVSGAFRENLISCAIVLEETIEPISTRAIPALDFKLICRQLIKNAIQALSVVEPPSGLKKLTISLTHQPQNSQAILTIADNGIGMDARTHRRCTRFGFSTTQHFRGIGLTLVSFALDNYHLQMEIISSKGEGSTFQITIPIR